jgi:hypothetical protein
MALDTTAKPTPKVAAVGVAGAVTIVLVWVAGLLGIEMPPEVAAAIATLLTFGAGYFKIERGSNDDGGEHVAR